MLPAVLLRGAARLNRDHKVFAAADKTASDFGNAGRDDDAGELLAEREGIAGERFHAAGDHSFLQVRERFETVLYGTDGFRDIEFRNADAVEISFDLLQPRRDMEPFCVAVAFKSGIFQRDDAVRQIDGGQMITGNKRAAACFR